MRHELSEYERTLKAYIARPRRQPMRRWRRSARTWNENCAIFVENLVVIVLVAACPYPGWA
jgi:hypothetical protein